MAEIIITNENFKSEVLNSDKPVLLDFWATWCGPCMMLSPTIAELAEEYEGKLKVGKINVDDEPELAEMFGISSIPDLIFIKDGQNLDSMVGYRPKADIVKTIEKML